MADFGGPVAGDLRAELSSPVPDSIIWSDDFFSSSTYGTGSAGLGNLGAANIWAGAANLFCGAANLDPPRAMPPRMVGPPRPLIGMPRPGAANGLEFDWACSCEFPIGVCGLAAPPAGTPVPGVGLLYVTYSSTCALTEALST